MTRKEGDNVTLWFTDGSKTYEVEIHKASNSSDYIIKVDNQTIPVTAEVVGPSRLHLNFDQYIAKCAVVKEGDKHFVFLDGEIYEFRKTSGAQINEAERADGEKNIRSPMPGRIIDVCVKEGDHVEANQDLVVIEAMKMETRLTAPCEATVKTISIKTGDQVDTDIILIELE
ncbi:MAG: acetyl-CoA carboxylase biotin carboxyl carrier protein subunit [Promethearchaeota archaeon]